MHPTTEQMHLEQANCHINAALARLGWLEGVLLEHQRNGLDAGLAESLMHNMRASLCLMIRYRLSIRRSLAQAGLLGQPHAARLAALEAAPPTGQPGPPRPADHGGRRRVILPGRGRTAGPEAASLFADMSLAG